jgi:ankyrin repeat protein
MVEGRTVLGTPPRELACGLTVGCGWSGSTSMSDDICMAAERGDLAEVQRLVGEYWPRRLNAKGLGWYTPLEYASKEGHVEVVRWLLDRGAVIGGSALNDASKGGHTPVVQLLLERGANPGDVKNGSTPLMRATENRHLETVRCLLDHPSAADTINMDTGTDGTALSRACARGCRDVVTLLLERRADPVITDGLGQTPLMTAIYYRYFDTVQLLLGHPRVKATINHRDFSGKTALWLALDDRSSCHLGVKALLEAGADLTIADNIGTTPMERARRINDPACIEVLEVRDSLRFIPPLGLLTGLT